MTPKDTKQEWEEYKARELKGLLPILAALGFVVDREQPHTDGERHLTRPIISGRKLLLLGRRLSDNKRVVIKACSEEAGAQDIAHDRLCREVLEDISFAYQVFLSPQEILFTKQGGYTILVTAFIEQERPFLERPLEEQFVLALKAFKGQESAHATTYAHARLISNTFGEMRAANYLKKFRQYKEEAAPRANLEEGFAFLLQNTETLEQYCGFLTHWDFMPQNIRVVGSDIYLLDHSSIHFGNKYEGWARFVNFMELYNPPLAQALVRYVRDNRTPEESLSLKLMRVYRLGELIRYYCGWLPRTEGALHALALARVAFWSTVMKAALDDKEIPQKVVEEYKKTRDSLRSEEEKERQKGLH